MANDFLKTINKFLRKYYSGVVILIFGLSLIIAGFIFYHYVWLVIKAEPEIKVRKIEVKEDVYKAILENINQREKEFLEFRNKTFPDIF